MKRPQGRTVNPVLVVNDGDDPIPVVPGTTANKTSVNFKIVTVADKTLAYQGPDVPIPPGFSVVVALRITQAADPVGYVASAEADVHTAAARKEIVKGFPLAFQIQNMDELWFGSDTDGAVFELYAEKV